MSADTINATAQLPVWTIHGVNWQVDVPLDEYNAQFPLDVQADEAATQAIAALKGKRPDLHIKLDEGETSPFLGTTMIAHLKDTDPNKGCLPLTHMMLANDGYYKEATEMFIAFRQQMQDMYEAYEAEEKKKQEEHIAQIKNFEKLQKAIAKNRTQSTPSKRKIKKPKFPPNRIIPEGDTPKE